MSKTNLRPVWLQLWSHHGCTWTSNWHMLSIQCLNYAGIAVMLHEVRRNSTRKVKVTATVKGKGNSFGLHFGQHSGKAHVWVSWISECFQENTPSNSCGILGEMVRSRRHWFLIQAPFAVQHSMFIDMSWRQFITSRSLLVSNLVSTSRISLSSSLLLLQAAYHWVVSCCW